jgi:pyrimidine-nucleoside phosphorylase
MRAVDVIRRKRDGLELPEPAIDAFVTAAACGLWPDYQLAAVLMAIYLRGMSPEETAHLTDAMVRSGKRLDLSDIPGPKVDKHSTGGVGDKTSLLIAPLVAACGGVVPMMSGRGLGHSGGTLDKLEAIPGFRVRLGLDQFREVLREAGCAMIGPTQDIAPADRKLYALRDVTGTVESVPLITASILSKKVAEGIDALILDVKVGDGAFMKDLDAARELAQSLVRVGRLQGLKVEAVLTAMDAPLGRAVGNALEVAECISALRGDGPSDMVDLSVLLSARMLRLAGIVPTDDEGATKVRAALASGAGLEKFRELVRLQGGDPRVADDPGILPAAEKRTPVKAPRPGYVTALLAEAIGVAAVRLGAGRERAEDPVDHAVGVVMHARVGDKVREGQVLAELHHRPGTDLEPALELMAEACRVGDAPPPAAPLVIETVTDAAPPPGACR